MSLDGKILSLARQRLRETRENNQQENARRRQQVYAVVPQTRFIDTSLRRALPRLLSLTLRNTPGSAQAISRLRDEILTLRMRKAELLVGAGFPEDYLEDIVSCGACRDTGYLPDGQPCACLMEHYRREQAKDLSSLMRSGQDRFSQFDPSVYPETVSSETGISPREQMSMVLSFCQDYAAKFGAESKNLLFRGSAGLGKTFLSACIARTVTEQGFSVVYDTAVSALEAFEREKFSRDEDTVEEASEKTRRILSCDLMILDDLGTEMTNTFTQSALYTIINTRLNNNDKTIISTNLTPEEMSLRYSPQIVSRIYGVYHELRFMGTDVRQVLKQRWYNR